MQKLESRALLAAVIAHYPFSSRTVSDIEGDADGTFLYGATTVNDEERGPVAVFDGDNDRLHVRSTSEIEVGANNADFSVSFFIKLRQDASSEYSSLIHKGGTALERTFAIYLQPETNQLHYRISTTDSFNEGRNSIGVLQRDRWTHVAYVKSGNQLSLYMDGQLDSSTVLRGDTIANSGPLTAGDDNWTNAAAMELDDLRIYSGALTPAEIAELASVGSETAGYDFTSNADDVVGNADGVLNGGASVVSDPEKGNVLSIDSDGQSLTVAHQTSVEVNEANKDFSVAFYVKLQESANGQFRTLIQKGDRGTQRAYAIFQRPDSNRLHYRISTDQSFNEGGDSVAELPVGVWTHVAYVKRDNQLALYIDGQFDSVATLSGIPISGSGDIRIGDTPWSQPAVALYDDIRIYHTDLTPEELQALQQPLNKPGVITLSAAEVTVNEQDGTVELTVNRTEGSQGVVSADFRTTNGTARSGTDFAGRTGRLTFADGETTKVITISVLDDGVIESGETFAVKLNNPLGGAVLGTDSIDVSIVDNDSAGVLSLAETSFRVAEDAGSVQIDFVRVGGSTGTVALDFTTVGSTANSGTDFVSQSGSVVFADGVTSQSITVPIVNDSNSEQTESFVVTVDRVTGGGLPGEPRTAIVTILDDDSPAIGSGTGLLGQYFANEDLTDQVLSRTDATIDFVWGMAGPDDLVGTDTFSVAWSGSVQPLYSETYTFFIRSDDGVRLWVDGQLLIDSWLVQSATQNVARIDLLAGEQYDIRLEYFDYSGTAVVELGWLSARQRREVIPASQLYLPERTTGLAAEYFTGTNFEESELTRVDAAIDFDWGLGSPVDGVEADNFSARWTGQVSPRYSETYTFRAYADQGVRVWVDNQLIINEWDSDPGIYHTGQIRLVADQLYDIRVEHFDDTGSAQLQLEWQSARQTLEIVPRERLSFDPLVNPDDLSDLSAETLVSGLARPTTIDFAADGRLFIAEKQGIVRIFDGGGVLTTPFIDISEQVNNTIDRGLLGLAVHPQFPEVPYIYVAYTYDPPETAGQTGLAGPDGTGNRVARVSRLMADASTDFNTAVPGSELVLLGTNSLWANISRPDLDSTQDISIAPSCDGGTLENCIPADSTSHSLGAMRFGADGMLFIASGDGAAFGRIDPRAARVQDIDSLSGKLLRIDPVTGAGATDNPFYDSSNPQANRSKVYSYGLRNPFRYALHPTTDEPFIGDVGHGTWEEVNHGRGENFGWPFYEGGDGLSLQTPGYENLPEAQAFYASGTPVTGPVWSRSHAAGARAIVVGDFYTGNRYPAEFNGALFITDFGDPVIRALFVNPDGSVNEDRAVLTDVGRIVGMDMGPDGYLYYTDIDGNIGRIVSDVEGDAITFDVDGDTLTVTGTMDDDDFLFNAAQPDELIINNETYRIDANLKLVLEGGGGRDTVILFGTAFDDTAVIRSGRFTFTTGATNVAGMGFDYVDIRARTGGTDRAFLFDSIGDDIFVAKPTYSWMKSPDVDHLARNFPSVVAYASTGTDVVQFYDSAGDETVLATPTYSRQTGASFTHYAAGFDQTLAFATAGGFDVATFFDSAQDDTYEARPGYGLLTGPNLHLFGSGFDSMAVVANAGGNDTADLFDSADDDIVVGRSDLTAIFNPTRTYAHTVKRFEVVRAVATAGGNDVVQFYDSTGNDELEAARTTAKLSGSEYSTSATGFASISAFSTKGGTDTLREASLLDYFFQSVGDWNLADF